MIECISRATCAYKISYTLLILSALTLDIIATCSDFKFWKTQPCLRACSAKSVGVVRSKMHCLASCSRDNTCDVVEYWSNGTCKIYPETCFRGKNRSQVMTGVTWYQKNPCQHDGFWIGQQQLCICKNGWIGTHCDRHPSSCTELRTYGYQDINMITLDLNGDGSKLTRPVVCYIGTTYTQTYVMRNDGWHSHNKTWKEYAKGYVINTENYWIGLENLRTLLQRNNGVLHFNSDYVGPSDRGYWHSVYKSFMLMDENFGFMYTVANNERLYRTGNLSRLFTIGDILSPGLNVKFSTADNDNDNDPTRNCAAEAGAGWWFNGCNGGVNPLGRNYRAVPGAPAREYIAIPGLNLSSIPKLRESFKYIAMYFTHTV